MSKALTLHDAIVAAQRGDESAESGGIVSRDCVITLIRKQLYRAVNDERRFTCETLAVLSRIKLRRIRSFMANDAGEVREAMLSAALSIACVLGAREVNEILALIGYGGAAPLDEPDEAQPAKIVAEGLQQFAIIASAAADNVIDHTEEPRTTAAADALIMSVLPLSSIGKSQ